jgi:hypothetical protein
MEPARATRSGPPAWVVVIPLIVMIGWILVDALIGH